MYFEKLIRLHTEGLSKEMYISKSIRFGMISFLHHSPTSIHTTHTLL